jgi:hypothetical protein
MNNENLQAAVSAGVMSAESEHRALLQSIVEVARAIFSAKAASIYLHDEEATSSSSRRSRAKARSAW